MVSIVVCVYNGARFVEPCVSAVLAQTYGDFELLLVDDGSTDDTPAALALAAARDARVRVIRKEHAGPSLARGAGVAAARGEYLAFLDADDTIEPDFFETLLARADETHADIVCCDYALEYPDRSRPVHAKLRRGETLPADGITAISYLNRRRAFFQFVWNKLYRRSLFDDITFIEENVIGEDYHLMLQVFERARTVDAIPYVGYHYVQTPHSMSRTVYTERQARSIDVYNRNFVLFAEKYPKEAKIAAHYLMTEYLAFVVAMSRNKNYDKERIKLIKRFVRKYYFGFLFATYVPFLMKSSATVFLISRPLFTALYRLITR